MISKGNHVKFACFVNCLPSVKKHKHDFFLFRLMYNKTIIRFGFCDIQNNQGLGKGYQPQPSASADNPYLDLDYSGFTKTSSGDCSLYTYICLIQVKIKFR